MNQQIRVDRRFAIIDEWVLDLDISDRAIRLYAVLARYADKDTHKAFPSRKTLAARLRCSPASVDRASTELVESGLLAKEHRYNNSIVYTVITSPPVMTPIVTGDETLSAPVMTPIVTGDDLTRTTKQESKELELLNTAFDEFWAVYPIKKDKALARRSFEKALKRVSAETIIEGARRHRDDPNRLDKYTKNPSTWLNADAWDNPPKLPRGATRDKPLTNNEHAALLAMKYRQEAQRQELEPPVNPAQAREIENEATNWLKGADDL